MIHKGARHVALRDGMRAPLGYVYAAGDSNQLQDRSGNDPAVSGLWPSRSGTATVMQHGKTHLSVRTTVGDSVLHTDQVTDTAAGRTTMHLTPADLTVTGIMDIDLPNAAAAQAFQRANLGKDLGLYNKWTNSCVTQVCEVLSAGADVPVGSTTSGARWLQERAAEAPQVSEVGP